jgi:adenine-specific DNA methylase
MAEEALSKELPFGPLPARPDERIPPGNTWTIQSVNYGDRCYGDLIPARSTLGLVYLARAINELAEQCLVAGASPDYVRALSAYATAAMMRKIRRSTRGSRLEVDAQKVGDVFANQSAILHSYDWFESGLSKGPGSWASLAKKTVATLRAVRERGAAVPAVIQRGSATMLPYRDRSMSAVVTDPPYDDMIDYSDSSDLFYVWAKRAMFIADSSLTMTMHPDGVQEKDEEIIVKRGGGQAHDHRTMEHYDTMIARAYAEMRRVVADDGVVTIVFGHNDLEVWYRMLSALERAGLVMTASWPAKTEAGGAGAGALNVVTTLTMSCRPATPNRKPGSLATVENQIRAEIAERFRLWERSGLARQDMLMASAGPAMEVAGRFSEITDNTGESVSLVDLLGTARRAVQEIALEKINSVPLERFDERTKFTLWWIELFQREQVAQSEMRWHSFTSGIPMKELQTLVSKSTKGCRFVQASQFNQPINERSALIDVVLAAARAWSEGDSEDVARVLVKAGREPDDEQLWATIAFLTERLPQGDADVRSWQAMSRESGVIKSAARAVQEDQITGIRAKQAHDSQPSLF